jgi:uncharacterized protein (TIGR02001 family)
MFNLGIKLTFLVLGFSILITFTSFNTMAQSKTDSKSGTGPKLGAEIVLLTNYTDKGLTQTEQEPAGQMAFGLQYTSGFLGIWGSNVKYVGEDNHFNYRIVGNLKFDITAGVDLTANYKYSRYVSDPARNGNIWGFDLNLYTYHVLIENEDNFEAQRKGRYWFAFGKEWPMWGMFLDTVAGYSMIQADGFTNYFDTRVALRYKWAISSFALVSTVTSTPSQFNGRAKAMFFAELKANF